MSARDTMGIADALERAIDRLNADASISEREARVALAIAVSLRRSDLRRRGPHGEALVYALTGALPRAASPNAAAILQEAIDEL